MTTLRHQDLGGSYNKLRTFSQGANNRLSAVTIGQQTHTFQYDAVGNMTSSNGIRSYAYDSQGNLTRFTISNGMSRTLDTYNLYDLAGNRLKKLVLTPNSNGGTVDIMLYLGTVEVRYTGMYISSTFSGPDRLSRSHFLKANGQTVLTMQEGNHPNELNTLFYTFADHLGSTCTLMEAGGHIICRSS